MIVSAACTDTGKHRESNEDCFLLDTENDLYLLADGMGGHAAGATAARMTVIAVHDFIQQAVREGNMTLPFGFDRRFSRESNILLNSVQLANGQVCGQASEDERLLGMGSTLVAVWILPAVFTYVHVGDSRLYLVRDGRLRQLTEDQTLVQERLREGVISKEQARCDPERNVVTQAVGSPDGLSLSSFTEPMRPGDLLLLCSDGLTDMVEEDDLRRLLIQEREVSVLCRELIQAALEAGGHDNVTAVLLQHIDDPPVVERQ